MGAHFISEVCKGQRCFCGRDATHRVREVILADDPVFEGNRKPGDLYTDAPPIVSAFVCCECFRGIMGPNARCEATLITTATKAYYHGCWKETGHYLFGTNGRYVEHEHMLGKGGWWFDGGYAPMRTGSGTLVWLMQETSDDARLRLGYRATECPQGEFLVHHRQCGGGYTIMAWWDRTADKRGASNSAYIVDVPAASSVDLLTWFPKHFPLQAKRLADAGVQLVEVKP